MMDSLIGLAEARLACKRDVRIDAEATRQNPPARDPAGLGMPRSLTSVMGNGNGRFAAVPAAKAVLPF